MISVKGGTQTWSKAAQQSSLKPEEKSTMDSQDLQKFLGENKSIGEALNKIVDPNWVDPTKTRKVGNDELGKDAFLKLLLAQMKNQDPTSPLESHEMAAQLAQFSSLEKLSSIETSLGTMANVDDPSQKFAALNMIGKSVAGDSTQIIRAGTDEEHDINFNLLGDAESVKINIKNRLGETVRELEIKDLKKGQNVIAWKGLSDEGATMGTGDYKVSIEAKAGDGRKVGAETKFAGVVTGVNFTAEGPVLMMGNQKVKINDVRNISQPTTADNKVNVAKVQNQVEAKNGSIVENKGESQIDGEIAMSQEMMNRVKKETSQ